MKESTTYQAILSEGRTEGLTEGRTEGRIEEGQRMLLRLGRKRLGEASPELKQAIERLDSVDKIEELLERVIEIETWGDLL